MTALISAAEPRQHLAPGEAQRNRGLEDQLKMKQSLRSRRQRITQGNISRHIPPRDEQEVREIRPQKLRRDDAPLELKDSVALCHQGKDSP